MSKKTNNRKQRYAQERLIEKNFICSTNATIKWCKNFLNRTTRRKSKQDLDKEMKSYEHQPDVID